MDRVQDFDGVARDLVAEATHDTVASIGDDERRMHVRAYNHWTSLLHGRDYPSIEDLEPEALQDFGPHGVLIDFTGGGDDPAIAWLGAKLREEGGFDLAPRALSQVPTRSLLSRLTDHYMQIIANRAPVGFEAEFVNGHGVETAYRGILLPYSSDGQTIDFIYGVINWKVVAPPVPAALEREVERALAAAPRPPALAPAFADGPNASPADAAEAAVDVAAPSADAALDEWLDVAREGAAALRTSDGRSRAALYRALGLAYDFALLAEARAADYAALLKRFGLKPQARAPMTPIAKLVFGKAYDKARLTEFAAALAHGRRLSLEAGAMQGFLDTADGGLKGVVRAERAARAPAGAAREDAGETARKHLRAVEPQLLMPVDAGEDEFVLLIARRVGPTAVGILGAIDDKALLERALIRAAA